MHGRSGGHYGAEVVYVGDTAEHRAGAHNPEEFGKLEAFVADQAESTGSRARRIMAVSHDPTPTLDDALLKAVKDTGADLVVMASHVPNIIDYIWPSNGGKIAEHSKARSWWCAS